MSEFLNKSLALTLWYKNDHSEEEVVVYPGILIFNEGEYYLQRQDKKNVKILTDWLPRIKKVPDDLKDILCKCQFQLSLRIGDFDGDTSEFEKTPLKWPM